MTGAVGDWSRFALYYAPPSGSPLARFGAAWMGWNPETAAPTDRLDIAGLPAPAAELTARASRYGLHATLKAPFRLRDGATLDELIETLIAFAATRSPAGASPLTLCDDLGFPHLRPAAPSRDIDALASALVETFDRFRAPSTEADLARRRDAALSPAQDAHLLRWGYPYVFDAFRFHITLSRVAADDERTAVLRALRPHVSPFLSAPFTIDEVCLFAEPNDDQAGAGDETYGGHFRLLRRFALTG